MQASSINAQSNFNKDESMRETEKKGSMKESGKLMMDHASEASKEKAKSTFQGNSDYDHEKKYEEHKSEAKEHGETFMQAAIGVAADAAQTVKDVTMNAVHKTAEFLGISHPEEASQQHHDNECDENFQKHCDESCEQNCSKYSGKDWSSNVDYSSHIKSIPANSNIDYSSHIKSTGK